MQTVVRRAAELSAAETDANELITEDELIRIGRELGLSERHVKQALYERPFDEPNALLDRHVGLPIVVTSRALLGDPEPIRRELENYFVTREYLQVVKRHSNTTVFEPAHDTFSKMARAFRRPRPHQLGRARYVELTVRQLEAGWSHVRLELQYPHARSWRLLNGALVGGLVGLAVSSGVGIAVRTLWSTSVAIASTAGMVTLLGFVFLGLRIGRARFQSWRSRTQLESEALLELVARGEELKPPPTPLARKLQLKLGRA